MHTEKQRPENKFFHLGRNDLREHISVFNMHCQNMHYVYYSCRIFISFINYYIRTLVRCCQLLLLFVYLTFCLSCVYWRKRYKNSFLCWSKRWSKKLVWPELIYNPGAVFSNDLRKTLFYEELFKCKFYLILTSFGWATFSNNTIKSIYNRARCILIHNFLELGKIYVSKVPRKIKSLVNCSRIRPQSIDRNEGQVQRVYYLTAFMVIGL